MFATKAMSVNNLWPDDFLKSGISPDHCADVLAGSYEVPFNPATPPRILDLGANIGAFARWAANRWPGSEIYCYEPHPDNFRLLSQTIFGCQGSNVVARNVGVYDRTGLMPLSLAKTNCGAHSLFDTGEIGPESIPVELITATDLPPADILKIDTEGAEWAILTALAGAGRLPEFSAIMLEYHDEKHRVDICALLAKNFVLVGDKVRCAHRGELKFMRRDLAPAATKKPLNIYISTPSHDHKFHAGFVFSLLSLLNEVKKKGLFNFTVGKVGGAGVARARNNMAQEFLAGPYTHFFCVDGDIRFEPEWFIRCIPHDLPIVGGLYSLKQHKKAWCLNTLSPSPPPDDERGLQEVATTGTGFLCIKREVFEAMIRAHPEIAYTDDLAEARGRTRWDFFSMGVVNGRYLSEDWYFCIRAAALGFKTFVDTTFNLGHEGMISFPIDADLITGGEEAAA